MTLFYSLVAFLFFLHCDFAFDFFFGYCSFFSLFVYHNFLPLLPGFPTIDAV